MARRKIGLVFGSGSARGWAHIGVIRELATMGIKPNLVAGSSIGAVVGGAYASGHLDEFEEWIFTLKRVDILKLLDFHMTGGGFIQGKALMMAIEKRLGNLNLEELNVPFACVATSLLNGKEHWLRDGSLLDAVRASIALPGIFAPVALHHDLMLDGGLVNPVPISLARAMGADSIIAVNLNSDLVGRHFSLDQSDVAADNQGNQKQLDYVETNNPTIATWGAKLKADLDIRLTSFISSLRKKNILKPGLFDVIAGSINIMQERITNSRMAEDPPDVLITPKLSHIGLMEFDRAQEAIREGQEATRRVADDLKKLKLKL
ncbi:MULTISPECIES: patatin-like phospholipase family protein [unclassified Legionella]|uniref:patatin-like phospholipase family protein n=1 Tax=unclassified Legionella TaxID=2622702 RepID=UPI001E5C7DC6|nr:patatin-like phospholipase family protein [Legionella sp. 31fI33]MCC5013792.1 patatin-like phospholipase family protein [Legionella sp. 31fI33]